MKSGDKIVVSVVATYAALNLAFMGVAARGALGRIPWSLFESLIGASIVGALVSVILLATASRSKVTWLIALAAAVAFGLLTWFNLICLETALAAV